MSLVSLTFSKGSTLSERPFRNSSMVTSFSILGVALELGGDLVARFFNNVERGVLFAAYIRRRNRSLVLSARACE